MITKIKEIITSNLQKNNYENFLFLIHQVEIYTNKKYKRIQIHVKCVFLMTYIDDATKKKQNFYLHMFLGFLFFG